MCYLFIMTWNKESKNMRALVSINVWFNRAQFNHPYWCIKSSECIYVKCENLIYKTQKQDTTWASSMCAMKKCESASKCRKRSYLLIYSVPSEQHLLYKVKSGFIKKTVENTFVLSEKVLWQSKFSDSGIKRSSWSELCSHMQVFPCLNLVKYILVYCVFFRTLEKKQFWSKRLWLGIVFLNYRLFLWV